ncbi:uncharacterized protein I206_105107 [Kwoniella pini CBS 10737]|uniref:Uncharacterized protein n=1 Tax=Kwoniella pini CBS 10737 TaxID=1296096 RepID=A0A1B9I8L2_9TREE|nr:uncharacterized protein I206_02648 [Kwoniella pini CBS 10737]OCF51932.1 hypothetical protein I206_02648 [Kwoniella pini CBS 10737]
MPMHKLRLRKKKDRVQVEAVNQVINIGGIRVQPRDIIIADSNGFVIVPRARAEEVAKVAKRIEESEDKIREMIENGLTLGEARSNSGYYLLTKKTIIMKDRFLDAFS